MIIIIPLFIGFFYFSQNYYEELVSVRDSQITKLQKDFDKLTRENEEHKKEMDRIVIELQQRM